MYRLLSDKKPARDERWHAELIQYSRPVDLYLYLMPDTAQLNRSRTLFKKSNYTELPALSPPTKFRADFEQDCENLLRLRTAIEQQEQNEHIKVLYSDRINELITNCQLWLAAADADSAAFERANITLYGRPDPTLHAATCAWFRNFALTLLDDPRPVVTKGADRVLQLVPDLNGDATLLIPDKTVYETMRSLHSPGSEYYDQLFAGIVVPTTGTISRTRGDDIIRHVLDTIRSSYTIMDAPDNAWAVSHSTKSVYRPAAYTMKATDFVGIVMHEIGSHLLERENGLRSPLRLLASGLAGYEHGNEGRAFLRQQVSHGSLGTLQNDQSWQSNVAKHLGVSLALGTATKPYNFAQVYAVLHAVYSLYQLVHTQDEQMAHSAAWAMTTRLLKGTDSTGGAYRKDIVYLEGNLRCWRIAAEDPDLIFTADIGKFNIADDIHLDHLRALNVISDTA